MSREETRDLIALLLVPKIGNRLAYNLINHFGSAKLVLEQPKKEFLKIQGIGHTIASTLTDVQSCYKKAEDIITHAERNDIQISTFQDENYPRRLKEKEILDFPLVFYAKGKADLNSIKTLSIIGTRSATGYGKRTVKKIIEETKKYKNLIIISGLAYGIDIESHKACLEYKIPTVAILGSGFKHIYPSKHINIARQIVEQGGTLITEYPYYEKPDKAHFPHRNRIIAGLSDAIIVVESANRGGALLTAHIANSYNKTIFAVPGSLESKFSEGVNNLINKNIANLYMSVQDLDYHLNWDINTSPTTNQTPLLFDNFEEKPQQIISFLKDKKKHTLDEIMEHTHIPLTEILEIMLDLEMSKVIERVGDGFKLIY